MLKIKYLTLIGIFVLFQAAAQTIPSPKEHFGNDIGTDYQLENFTKTEAYFKKLAELSDRVKLVDIGPTEEGRRQPMMIVTSPENHKNLDRYKELSQKLARAEISTEEAKKLIKDAKPVIWIDGGLHSTETVGTHQLIETYYQLVSRQDEETLNILDNVIILLAHANPDGHELVSDWYMREKDPEKRNMRIPRLYQKYAGHDNNRDFYMNNLKETTNISKQQYIEWMPQIIYNHHQTGPAGTVVAGPPYRDPFNHAFDPMLITGIDGVGAAMINGLFAEDKPGYTRLGGSQYSTWWNGGLRTTPYFHNMIGILTEIIGNPTPSEIPFVPSRLLATNDTPYPIQPQKWHFRQSIDYSVSMNYAILNYARTNGENLLFNIYKMGRNSIEKGNRDSWSPLPQSVEKIKAQYEADRKAGKFKSDEESTRQVNIPEDYYSGLFGNKERRDPRGFILPADQEDFPTAIVFINALVKSGIQIHKATEDFTVEGKNYPTGSYIVKTAQAFRPHVLDMFEPQDHPNDFQYPGGPPIRPYDAAGWTLAYQMGVDFDRILDGFDGPFTSLPYGELQVPGTPTLVESSEGYIIDGRSNYSFLVVNRLLDKDVKVHRITEGKDKIPGGSFFVPASAHEFLQAALKDTGVKITPSAKLDQSNFVAVTPSRIALVDYYGGSMPSGWVRWLLEEFQYPYEVIYPQDIDKGDLNSKYDVILFMGGGIARNLDSNETPRWNRQPDAKDIPTEYRSRLGLISGDKSLPELKKFLENGGNIVTVGSSTNLAYHLDLPVRNALVEIGKDGKEQDLPGVKYYVPGSILTSRVDTDHPANWGMGEYANIMFNNSNVFKFRPEARQEGLKALAWIDNAEPLKSGWAWGQSYLEDGIVAFTAQVGKGSFYAYSPEIIFRGQSYNTFKMLFNNLLIPLDMEERKIQLATDRE